VAGDALGRLRRGGIGLGACLLALTASAASPAKAPAAPVEADEYTRYELLAPGSSRFHILYEVTAISPGATAFFNPIRKGSEASDERVFDRMTGRPLSFRIVPGDEARRGGLADAEPDVSYIRIELPRPVPEDGGVRLLIEKTYRDSKSYFEEDGRLVFSRSLGIRRNAIVFPAGYEIVDCNVPAQVFREPDGRMRVSFMHGEPDAVNAVVRARKLAR
jgi:hypothetical protein